MKKYIRDRLDGGRNFSLEQELAKVQKENARLRDVKEGGIYLRVSKKGGVSVYGIRAKWPITLYDGQWDRLLDAKDMLLRYIKDHDMDLPGRTIPARFAPWNNMKFDAEGNVI